MSAQLTIGMWIDWLRSGVRSGYGSASSALEHSGGGIADFTTTGARPPLTRLGVECAAGEETVLWDWTDDPIVFELALVNSDSIGFLLVYVDDETSGTNPDPAGTHRHKFPIGIGCRKPQTLTTYQALTTTTASDPTGYAVDPSTLTVGRVYKVSFYNPNDTAAAVDFVCFS